MRRIRAGATAAILVGGILALPATPAAQADPPQDIASCDEAGLDAAVAAGGDWMVNCSGETINVANPLTVSGKTVSLTGFGTPPFINGTGFNGLFRVTSGSLALTGLTLTGNEFPFGQGTTARGGALLVGAGAHATLDSDLIQNSFAQGDDGMSGTTGTAQSPAGTNASTPGSDAQGGGVYNAGTLDVTNTTFHNDSAIAGNGGVGGSGVTGSTGADGPPVGTLGAPGVPGQPGTAGGGGGDGTPGGTGQGAGIYNAGTLTVHGGRFEFNTAQGGIGGGGGSAGNGGSGGNGSAGGGGASGTAEISGAGSPGGDGGAGGAGGAGGGRSGTPAAAGPGYGGGIYNAGTALVLGTQFFDDVAVGGVGASGGNGADGGNGGIGGAGGNGGIGGDDNAVNATGGMGGFGGSGASAGAPGATGANAQAGGPGGDARGGGVYDTGGATIVASTFSADRIEGGFGGSGGRAGSPNNLSSGVAAGRGGSGGSGGEAASGNGGQGGAGGHGGHGGLGTTAAAAAAGGPGGEVSALTLFTTGGTHVGCLTIAHPAAGEVSRGHAGAGGPAGSGVPHTKGAAGGFGGSGGAGKDSQHNGAGGTNGGPGGNGAGGGRAKAGPSGLPGAVGPVQIDGSTTPVVCDSVSPTSVSVSAALGKSATEQLTLTNGGGGSLSVSGLDITGADASQFAAKGCASPVAAHHHCVVTVTFTPTAVGGATASLHIADNAYSGGPAVPLGGTGTAAADASVLSAPTPATIKVGQHAPVTTLLTDGVTLAPISGVPLELMQEPAGTSTYTLLRSKVTDSAGKATVSVGPSVNTRYRWTYAGNASHRTATSSGGLVSVAQVVTAALSKSKVKHRKTLKVYGTVRPSVTGGHVAVERKVHGAWKPLGSGATLARQKLPDGSHRIGYVVTLHAGKRGTERFRAQRAATAKNAAGTSPAVTLTVT